MFGVGLDPGKQRDPAALAIVERVETLRQPNALPGTPDALNELTVVTASYHIRWLEQADLGTPYTALAERVEAAVKNPILTKRVHLVIDDTGVGQPVLDMLIAMDLSPIGITITGGTQVTKDNQGYNVPKRDLVTMLASVFQTGRVKIAKQLPLADRLKEQLLKFSAKITRTKEMSFEALTEDVHDDLVIAIALPIWYLEKINGHQSVVAADRRFNNEPYPPWDPLRSGL